jgi:hypothetical protein
MTKADVEKLEDLLAAASTLVGLAHAIEYWGAMPDSPATHETTVAKLSDSLVDIVAEIRRTVETR